MKRIIACCLAASLTAGTFILPAYATDDNAEDKIILYVSTDGKGLIDTSDDGKELSDTSIVSEELLDKLLSVVERVASESLPLYEVFSARDASDVIENEMNADTAREFVKFACAISEEKEPQIGGDGLFEEPASFDPNSNYDISFADAYDVQITWPSDFDSDCDEE